MSTIPLSEFKELKTSIVPFTIEPCPKCKAQLTGVLAKGMTRRFYEPVESITSWLFDGGYNLVCLPCGCEIDFRNGMFTYTDLLMKVNSDNVFRVELDEQVVKLNRELDK